MSPEAAAAAVQEEVKNRVERTKRQVDAKMEQAKWQPVLMLKKSKKLRCRKSWHCSQN